jgi:hypothetical protein
VPAIKEYAAEDCPVIIIDNRGWKPLPRAREAMWGRFPAAKGKCRPDSEAAEGSLWRAQWPTLLLTDENWQRQRSVF